MEPAVLSADVLVCTIDRWTGIWGDPLVRGTVTMALYGAAGLLLLRVSRRTEAKERWLWRVCAVVFLFLMLNTHLDLHALVRSFGHCVFEAQEWRHLRGPVKLAGFLLVAMASALALIAAGAALRRSIRSNLLVVVGVAIALGFALFNGAGPHEWVGTGQVGPFRWGDLMEYGGIAMAALAALARLRRLNRQWRGQCASAEP